LFGEFLGESFVDQNMRNPKTGERHLCVAHDGRGSPTKAELDAINSCIADYEAKGFVRTT
jgi:hypothetical protein